MNPGVAESQNRQAAEMATEVVNKATVIVADTITPPLLNLANQDINKYLNEDLNKR